MVVRNQDTAERLQRLEWGLHEGLQAWAQDHARRYAQIGMLSYDPVRFAAQRIGTSVTPRAGAEHVRSVDELRRTYLMSAGAVAEETLAAFEESNSCRGRMRPAIGNQIRELVERGKSVAVLCAHADGLDDAAGFAGAIAVAMHGSSAASRNGLILNKVMSRETFAGAPIVMLLRAFTNIFWVIPDSGNARRWGVSEHAVRYVNALGVRSLLAAIREGAAITFAPAGSAMIPRFDDQQRLVGLRLPPAGTATMKLLSRFDFYLVTARFGGRIQVGELRPVCRKPAIERAASAHRLMDEALDQLAAITELVAGVAVETSHIASGDRKASSGRPGLHQKGLETIV